MGDYTPRFVGVPWHFVNVWNIGSRARGAFHETPMMEPRTPDFLTPTLSHERKSARARLPIGRRG
jgi:hypothetical protein